jgi:DNA-binding MarR family transcriptional regulator
MNFETNIGRYTGVLHQSMQKRLSELLEQAQTGITADQFRLLTHLWKEDGITQQQLAYLLKRDKAGVTRMVDILEKQHLVTRIANKQDRRANLVYLTKTGKELENSCAECAKQCLQDSMQDFTIEEQNMLATLLQKAIQNLNS